MPTAKYSVILTSALWLSACYNGDTEAFKAAVQINQLNFQSLSLSSTNDTLELNEQVTPIVTATLNDGTTTQANSYVQWSTSNPDVLQVTQAGLVTGLSDGNATITVSFGDLNAELPLAVSSAALVAISASISTDPVPVCTSSATLTATGTYDDGRTGDISDKVSWLVTLNDHLAQVSAGALVTTGAGNVSLTATRDALTSEALPVSIVATLNGIALSPLDSSIEQGKTIQYEATGSYDDGSSESVTQAATWSVANTDGSSTPILTASTSIQGLYSADTVGTANVSAACAGFSASTGITVTEPLAISSIAIDGGSLISKKVSDDDFQLTATITYNNSTTEDVTDDAFWSVDEVLEGTGVSVNNVDTEKGEVSIRAEGKTVIKVTYEGFSDTIQINVEED